MTSRSEPTPGVALPLVRKRVQAKNVRVGDYWELPNGMALRVNKVSADETGMVTIDMGSRTGGSKATTWARGWERVEIRRLKTDAASPA